MNYDTLLFIDIIESIKGIKFIRSEEIEGVRAMLFEGLTGRLVVIDITEEEITENVGKAHLIQLGIADLIPSIFPPQPV